MGAWVDGSLNGERKERERGANLLNLMFRSCLETVDVWDLN